MANWKFNLSVFIYENATNNAAESYHWTLISIINTLHPNHLEAFGLFGQRNLYNIELKRLI